MTAIVGTDPGNKGAFAILDPENARMRIFDMPTFTFTTTKEKTYVDVHTICRELGAQPLAHLYMEAVYSSPQMGVVSAFAFGEGKGMILGAAAGMGIPTTQVKPTQWKKQMRIPADKRAATQRASQLFPDIAALFHGPRGGIFDGRAEAALIALYGAMEQGRTPTAPITLWE